MSDIIFNDKNEVIDLKNKNKADYKSLAKNNQLSEKFILENADFLDWNIISENQALTVDIMVKCAKKIKWKKVLTNPHIGTDAYTTLVRTYKGDLERLANKEKTLSDDFVRTYQHLFDFSQFEYHKVSNELLQEIADKINWTYVFAYDRKEEAFIRKNMHYFEKYDANDQKEIWEHISTSQTVSETFLREFDDRVCFEYIGSTKGRQVLSDAFVENYKYILDQFYITSSQKQNLSPAYFKAYKKFDLDKFYENATEEWIRNYPHQYQLNWNKISELKTLSEAFILENFDKLTLSDVVHKNRFSEEFAREIISISPKKDLEDNLTYIFSQSHTQAFFEEYMDKVSFDDISYSPLVKNFSLDFIRKHQKKIDWSALEQEKRFDEDFLREFEKKWDWNYGIARYQRVSEGFLREFKHKFDSDGWSHIFEYQKLTEKFIREIIIEFPRKIDWGELCQYQNLSEGFLTEYAKKLDWSAVSRYQILSPAFKETFKKNIEERDDYDTMMFFYQKANNILIQEENDHERLQEALEFANQALFYQTKQKMKGATYVDDVKAHILIALGNKEAAYNIVKSAFESEYSTYCLDSFKYDFDFLEWWKLNRVFII